MPHVRRSERSLSQKTADCDAGDIYRTRKWMRGARERKWWLLVGRGIPSEVMKMF